MPFFKDFKPEIKILLIVALIAVVISVAGILLLKETQTLSPVPSPQSQTLDTSDSTPSEVEGWQTYRNDEFGFEFDYPKQYAALEECKVREESNFFEIGDGISFSVSPGEGKELKTHVQDFIKQFNLYENYTPEIVETEIGTRGQIPGISFGLDIPVGGGGFRTESGTFFCKNGPLGCDTVFEFSLEGYPYSDEYALDVIPSARSREDFWSSLPCKDALIQGVGLAEEDVMFDRELFDQILSTFRFIQAGEIKTGTIEVDYSEVARIQKSVDEGHQPWRLNPVMVALSEAYSYGFTEDDKRTLSTPDVAIQNKFGTEITEVNLEIKHRDREYVITLIQPIPGPGKIWLVSYVRMK